MLDFAKKYSDNIFSQCGEDGLLTETLRRLNMRDGVCVEYGAHDGIFCSNTRLRLTDVGQNWKGYMYEADEELFKRCVKNCFGLNVNVENKMITPKNVNDIPECNILSSDCDGNDYAIWENYTGKPDIVIIEINSSLPPMTDHFTIDKGASYISMLKLGISKGYFLLTHTGNLVFILDKHRKLFPEIVGNGIENYSDYFNTSWL